MHFNDLISKPQLTLLSLWIKPSIKLVWKIKYLHRFKLSAVSYLKANASKCRHSSFVITIGKQQEQLTRLYQWRSNVSEISVSIGLDNDSAPFRRQTVADYWRLVPDEFIQIVRF